MVLLGDRVTVSREIAGQTTWITGQISGLVLKDSGDLKYFYIKGIETSLWMNDGWAFDEESESEIDDEDDDNL